jgi:hypothetical protein
MTSSLSLLRTQITKLRTLKKMIFIQIFSLSLTNSAYSRLVLQKSLIEMSQGIKSIYYNNNRAKVKRQIDLGYSLLIPRRN